MVGHMAEEGRVAARACAQRAPPVRNREKDGEAARTTCTAGGAGAEVTDEHVQQIDAALKIKEAEILGV